MAASPARAQAERLYSTLRHAAPVTKTVDLVVRGYGAAAATAACTDGDSANLRVALRWTTTSAKREPSIYATAVGHAWRYLSTMRLLVDDWLLTPRPAPAFGPEPLADERGVIETIAFGITRQQLVLVARAKSVQLRVIGGGAACDLALDPVSQGLIGLFVERELPR